MQSTIRFMETTTFLCVQRGATRTVSIGGYWENGGGEVEGANRTNVNPPPQTLHAQVSTVSLRSMRHSAVYWFSVVYQRFLAALLGAVISGSTSLPHAVSLSSR